MPLPASSTSRPIASIRDADHRYAPTPPFLRLKGLARSLPLISLVALVTFAQQSPGPSQQPRQDKAQIVFFRESHFDGSGLKPSVYVDGEDVGRLTNGHWFSVDVPPGKHRLASSAKHEPDTVVDCDAGQTIYVQMILVSGTWHGFGRLLQVDSEQAQIKLAKLTKTEVPPVEKAGTAAANTPPQTQPQGKTTQPTSGPTGPLQPPARQQAGATSQAATLGATTQEEALRTNGRGAIGVNLGPPDQTGGIAITAVLKDGPAARAGIQVGDVVLRVDGLDFTGAERFAKPPGSQIQIEYRRGATTTQTVTVTEDQLSLYMRVASTGDTDAEVVVGNLFSSGDGVAKDYEEALKWYRKAADSGSPQGQDHMGWMYENGLGVGKDEKTALDWYRKAAAQGYAAAEYRVGTFYEVGRVVPTDRKAALQWYSKAAAQGAEYAKTKMLAMNLPDGCDRSFKYQIRWPGLAHYVVRDIYEKQIREDTNPNITAKEFQEGPNNTAVVKYNVQITGYSPQDYTIRIGGDGIYTTWTGGPSTSFFGVLFDESDSNLHQSSMQYNQLLPVRKVRYGDINAFVPLVKKDKDRDKFENSKDWTLVSNQQVKGVDDAYRFADALNTLICESQGFGELRRRQWGSSIQSLRAQAAQWRAQAGQAEIPEQARNERILAEQAIDEKDMVGVILHYQNALDAYPLLPKAWFNSALAYEQIGAYKEAAEFMKAYIELVPDAPDTQEARAKVVVWEDKARQ